MTGTALTQMVDDWYKEMEQREIVEAVLLDFSAVFDILDHELLLEKLIHYGFSPSAILSIKSDRKQIVYLNGNESDIRHLRYRLPQGSCLGPPLY